MPLAKAGKARVRKSSKRYHHGDLRAAAIGAATKSVAERGLEALSLRDLANELGVSPPALHHHFANKTDLIAAAAGAAFAELDQELATAEAAPAESAAATLEELTVTYVRFAIERPGAFRFIFGSHVRSLDLSSYPEVFGPGRSCKTRIQRAVAAAFGEDCSSTTGELRFAILWAQAVGVASLIVERELDSGSDLGHAIALTRAAVRSHLAGLRSALHSESGGA
ncbi:MAG TPA: TetR/AcrR family transcriptional regulator [Polyangiaceae bacterium]|nr:TetR/AcrR family transcriptional regulator [Polyangiaceae bacterium]